MSGKEYRTITDVKGPLVFLNKTEPVAYGEIVQLRLTDGTMKNGQVLDTSDDQVIVQGGPVHALNVRVVCFFHNVDSG